jgi:plasmid stabilization system protein ParE
MKVVVLASAEQDLSEAAAYYLEHASVRIAQAFADEFRHATVLLADYPESGMSVSDNQRVMQFRRFPYSIIYRAAADSVVIRAVAHHRRKPRYGKNR